MFVRVYLGQTLNEDRQMAKVRSYPKRGTIGRYVLDRLKSKPSLKCQDLMPYIQKHWPDSRFNPAHLAWYRHQVRVGAYKYPEKQK
jgi:hypothetical protein